MIEKWFTFCLCLRTELYLMFNNKKPNEDEKNHDVCSVFYDLIYSSLADHVCTLSFNRSSECAYKKLTHIDSRTIEVENRATPSLCHRLWKYAQKKGMTWNSNELEHGIWSQKGITFDVSLTFQFIADYIHFDIKQFTHEIWIVWKRFTWDWLILHFQLSLNLIFFFALWALGSTNILERTKFVSK